jgi:hypothetical protein
MAEFVMGFCLATGIFLAVGIVMTKRDIRQLKEFERRIDRLKAMVEERR